MLDDRSDEIISTAPSRSADYLALPGSGSGPGIVLLHDPSAGATSARQVADLYAEEGYVVLVPEQAPAGASNPDAALGAVAAAGAARRARPEGGAKIGLRGLGGGGPRAA